MTLQIVDITQIKGSGSSITADDSKVEVIDTGTGSVVTTIDGNVRLTVTNTSLHFGDGSLERIGYERKVFFDNSKGAFRAGIIGNYNWDDANRGGGSVAFGHSTKASGNYSYAEGSGNTASGESSHAEGTGCTASGYISHAEGIYCVASGIYSHAEGYRNTTNLKYASHVEGARGKCTNHSSHTKASGRFSADGDAQYERNVLRVQTANNISTEMEFNISDDTTSSKLILPANSNWRFEIDIIAKDTTTKATVASHKIIGGIERDSSNNTVLTGIFVDYKEFRKAGYEAITYVAEADNTNEALIIKATGLADTTIGHVATVNLTEVM